MRKRGRARKSAQTGARGKGSSEWGGGEQGCFVNSKTQMCTLLPHTNLHEGTQIPSSIIGHPLPIHRLSVTAVTDMHTQRDMNHPHTQLCLVVHTLPKYTHSGEADTFPVVMYGCESWPIKKAERRRIDAFELWCWRRFLRGPRTARRSIQSILKEISPEYSLELNIHAEAEASIRWPPVSKN